MKRRTYLTTLVSAATAAELTEPPMTHDVILNDGDKITERRIQVLLGRQRISGYAEGNPKITVHDDNTVDVGPAVYHIYDQPHDVTIVADGFVGKPITGGATNHLYITYDDSATTDEAAVSLDVRDNNATPGLPHLEFARINPGGGVERVNGDDPVTERFGDALPDYTVTTTDGLIDAFDSVAPGQHIHITDKGAPYRTTQYLDLDVSGVTVTGEGAFPLVKVADGANVGGIRVGHHSHVEDITIDGFSFHGNPANQTAARGGFGISLKDVANVVVRHCHLERTWPFHEHNQENSGMMIRQACSYYTVENCLFRDIGDRAISTSGTGGRIVHNVSVDGFDRMVSLAGTGGGGAHQTVIAFNQLFRNAMGSMIGISGDNPIRQALILGNMAMGNHRCLVTIQNPSMSVPRRYVVAYNFGVNTPPDSGSQYPGLRLTNSHVTAIGNECYNYKGNGVVVENAEEALVKGNYFQGCMWNGADVRDTENARIEGNTFKNNCHERPNEAEIKMRSHHNVVRNNLVPSTLGAAIFEDVPADQQTQPPSFRGNLYDGNVSRDGDLSLNLLGVNPYSIVRDNVPAFDVFYNESDDDGDGVVDITLNKAYGQRPEVTFGRRGGGIGDVSFDTNDNNNVTHAHIQIDNAGDVIDVFFDLSGATI